MSLVSFCMMDLLGIDRWVLMSPTIIVGLYIQESREEKERITSFWRIDPSDYVIPFFILDNIPSSKVCSETNLAISVFSIWC